MAKSYDIVPIMALICSAAQYNAHVVVTIPDEKQGEQLVLVTTRQAAVMRVSRVSQLAVPKRLHFVEKIPLLGSGKVD